MKTSPIPNCRQNSQKAAALHALVGEVGPEVIEGLLLVVRAGKDDLDAARAILSVGGRLNCSILLDGDEAHLVDGLAGASQEHIEDRQGAAQLTRIQVGAHVAGDEVAAAEQRADGAADALQIPCEKTGAQGQRVRLRANQLETSQDVGGRVGEERVSIKEVRAAEEVVRHRPPGGDIGARPRPHLGQLILFEPSPHSVHQLGVLLPGRVLGQRCQLRALGGRQAGDEAGRVVGRGRLGTVRWRRGNNERSHPQGGNSLQQHGHRAIQTIIDRCVNPASGPARRPSALDLGAVRPLEKCIGLCQPCKPDDRCPHNDQALDGRRCNLGVGGAGTALLRAQPRRRRLLPAGTRPRRGAAAARQDVEIVALRRVQRQRPARVRPPQR